MVNGLRSLRLNITCDVAIIFLTEMTLRVKWLTDS